MQLAYLKASPASVVKPPACTLRFNNNAKYPTHLSGSRCIPCWRTQASRKMTRSAGRLTDWASVVVQQLRRGRVVQMGELAVLAVQSARLAWQAPIDSMLTGRRWRRCGRPPAPAAARGGTGLQPQRVGEGVIITGAM